MRNEKWWIQLGSATRISGLVNKFFSAKGAECDSQGQALSSAKRVAPGTLKGLLPSSERAAFARMHGPISHFQCSVVLGSHHSRGAVLRRRLSTCPWLLHVAPLALLHSQVMRFKLESTNRRLVNNK